MPSATLGMSAGNSFEVHPSFTIKSILESDVKDRFFTSGAAPSMGSIEKCSLCSFHCTEWKLLTQRLMVTSSESFKMPPLFLLSQVQHYSGQSLKQFEASL